MSHRAAGQTRFTPRTPGRRGARHARPPHPERHPARRTNGHRHRHPGRTHRRGRSRNRGDGTRDDEPRRLARDPALRRPPLPPRLDPERGKAAHQPERHPARGDRDLGRPRAHPDGGRREAPGARALPLVDRPGVSRDPQPRGRYGRFADGGGCAAGAPARACPVDRPSTRRLSAEWLLPLPEWPGERRPRPRPGRGRGRGYPPLRAHHGRRHRVGEGPLRDRGRARPPRGPALRRDGRPQLPPRRDSGEGDRATRDAGAGSWDRTSPPCTRWTTTTSASSCR